VLVSAELFIQSAMTNPINGLILQRLPQLELKQCYLTAGCLFQTVWNQRSGHPPQAMIKDCDVFYFDESDLSWEAEDDVIQRGKALFEDLGVAIEIKNQARVHLWYEQRFGCSYPRLESTKDGIDRYLIACTGIGIDVATGALYAPNGLAETWAGVLRMNPMNPQPELFQRKAADYRARWPWLTIQH
jgi:uncharacterized protein